MNTKKNLNREIPNALPKRKRLHLRSNKRRRDWKTMMRLS